MSYCIAPVQIKNPKTKERIHVPCAKCNFCLQNRRLDWSFRLQQELKHSSTADFLTLTYDNNTIPIILDDHKQWYFTLKSQELINFHRTLRKSQARTLTRIKKRKQLNRISYTLLKQKWKLKYYSVGEYGTRTKRPHYHSIIFNIHPDTKAKIEQGKIWEKGILHRGEVNAASISYVAKYVIDKQHCVYSTNQKKPFSIMSKGIGANYLKTNYRWHMQKGDTHDDYRYYVMNNGTKQRLPRYYKDKIFSTLDKLIQAPKSQERALMEYLKEIERLGNAGYIKPEKTYEEQKMNKYNRIKSKSEKLNKI